MDLQKIPHIGISNPCRKRTFVVCEDKVSSVTAEVGCRSCGRGNGENQSMKTLFNKAVPGAILVPLSPSRDNQFEVEAIPERMLGSPQCTSAPAKHNARFLY